jgi:anaerobic ribonucleoside-triphosphate reductase activating protein
MRLALSRVHYPVLSLGPGMRVGIWFQGCSIRCRGCISSDTWAPDRGVTTVEDVFKLIRHWLKQADGVTISGGEPFDQTDALRELLTDIRRAHRGDILVYSGYSFESLAEKLKDLEGLIDGLIADPFEMDTAQSLALRGSDNQRLFTFTPLGKERFQQFDRAVNPSDRHLDVMFDDATGEVWFAGIPGRGDFHRLAGLLSEGGHKVTTTEDKR